MYVSTERGQATYASDGTPSRFDGVNCDITKRWRAEEELRRGEERYRTLFETMTKGFALHEVITDELGRPCDSHSVDVNPAFERLMGLKCDDLIDRQVLEVLPAIGPNWIPSYGNVTLWGESVHMENYAVALGRWYRVFYSLRTYGVGIMTKQRDQPSRATGSADKVTSQ